MFCNAVDAWLTSHRATEKHLELAWCLPRNANALDNFREQRILAVMVRIPHLGGHHTFYMSALFKAHPTVGYV